MAVTHRLKNELIRTFIIGLAILLVGTIAVYFIGYTYSQTSSSFNPKYSQVIQAYSMRYFASAFASIASIIAYSVIFFTINGRSETEWPCIRVQGEKYIENGWLLWCIIGTVITLLVALIIHFFAFEKQLVLVKPLMWWVFLLQVIVSVIVYFLPFTKPLKKA